MPKNLTKFKLTSRKAAFRETESSLRNKLASSVVIFEFDDSHHKYLEKNDFMVLEKVKVTLVEIIMNQRFSVMVI